MSPLEQCLLPLEPQYRERVWGGQRLRTATPPIGEAWIAHGPSRIAGGPLAGRTLDELITGAGPGLLGTEVASRFAMRFPLLVKLLDPASWLSARSTRTTSRPAGWSGPGSSARRRRGTSSPRRPVRRSWPA